MADFYSARLYAVDKAKGWPYFASAIYALQPIMTDSVPTLATDRWWRCYINEGFLKKLAVEQAAAAIVHEVGHLLHKHFDRSDAVLGIDRHTIAPWQTTLTNVCQDISINAAGELYKKLPPGCITAAYFHVPPNLLWEVYYRDLCQRVKQDATGVYVTGCGPNSDENYYLQAPAMAIVCSGGCGSSAHGQPMPWDAVPPTDGGPPGVEKHRGELIARQVAEAIKSCGVGSGSWQRWADSILSPQVDWRIELAACVRCAVSARSGDSHTDRSRLARRQHLQPDIVRLARRSIAPSIAVITDTSGSMNEVALGQALGEISGVIQALGPAAKLLHLSVDGEVHNVQVVRHVSEISLAGGGGTDMGVGLAFVEAEKKKGRSIDVVVVLTDGFTPWPDQPPPDCRVIVVLVGDGDGPRWAYKSEIHKTIKVK